MKVDFWFALKQAAWAVGNLRNPHHNTPGGLDGTNGLGRFGAVVCDLGPKSVELTLLPVFAEMKLQELGAHPPSAEHPGKVLPAGVHVNPRTF